MATVDNKRLVVGVAAKKDGKMVVTKEELESKHKDFSQPRQIGEFKIAPPSGLRARGRK